MSGRELGAHHFGSAFIDPDRFRRMALHCADRVAAEHPTEYDDIDPVLAGRLIAQDPAVRDQVLELLDAIGYTRKETP